MRLTSWTSLGTLKTVSVYRAKKNSSLVAKPEKDSQSTVMCRDGVLVTDLVPRRRKSRIKAHPGLSKIEIGCDQVESLSADEWPEAAR
jgi:hypothetical protein